MKKNNILFGLISILCVGTAAGCSGDGEPRYNIRTALDNLESGRIEGAGKYKNGENVALRLYPAEGCGEDNPTMEFSLDGSNSFSAATHGNFRPSSDNSHFVYEFTLNTGEDGGASTVGTYRAAFTCRANSLDNLDEDGVAEFNIGFKVLKDANDESKGFYTGADGTSHILPAVEVKYGAKVPQTNYIDGVDGKITWYLENSEGKLTADSSHLYDFTQPVKSHLNLIGIVSDATDFGIVTDAINNFKATDKLIITNKDGVAATVLNLKDMETKKLYFQLGNEFLITNNTYYQIKKNGGSTHYYKLNLADPTAAAGYEGFKAQDIKDVYDHIELNFLEYVAADVSVKKSGPDPVKETVEVLGYGGTYNSTDKEFAIGSFGYKIDGDNKIIKGESEVVGELKNSVYLEFNAGENDGNTYKIVGDEVKLVVESVECKIYQIHKSGDLYMELYIHNGKVYKTVRHNSDGSTFSNVIEYTTADIGTTKPSLIYDMNLLKLTSTDATLNTALAAYNASFESILKNVTVEAKTLKTLIESNSELRDLLRAYDYTIENPAITEGDKTVDTSMVFPIDINNSLKTLQVKVNASYSTVQGVIDSLQSGGFKIITTTEIFGRPESEDFDVAAGTDVLKATHAGINDVIAQIFTELDTLNSNYSTFKYSVENKGAATEKNIYRFYASNNDASPYLIVTLDKDGKILNITYTEFEANGDAKNTYVSTFEFPPAA